MKEQIELLIKLGLSKEHAIAFMKSASENAWKSASFNYLNEDLQAFSDWFKCEISTLEEFSEDSIKLQLKRMKNQITAILTPGSLLTWQHKYDLIFSDQISAQISKLLPDFSCYIPDTSYEEDVTYYTRAFIEYYDENFKS